MRPQWRPKFPAVAEQLARHEKTSSERVRTFWADATARTLLHRDAGPGPSRRGARGDVTGALWAASKEPICHRADRHRAGVRVPRRPPPLPAAPGAAQGVPHALPLVHGPPPRGVGAHRRDLAGQPPHVARGRAPGRGGDGERADAGRGDPRGVLRDLQRACWATSSQRIDAGYPLLVVPCLFFGKSLYLEFPGLTVVGSGFQRNDAAARARTESLARRLKTVADPTRLALLHYLAGTAEHGGRPGHVLRPGPTDGEHAHEVAPRVGPGALGAQGRAAAAQRRPRRRRQHGRRAAGRRLRARRRAESTAERSQRVGAISSDGCRPPCAAQAGRPRPATPPSSVAAQRVPARMAQSMISASGAPWGASRTSPRRAWSWRTSHPGGMATPASASRATALPPSGAAGRPSPRRWPAWPAGPASACTW